MTHYQQVLDIAREQSAALRRGELEAAVALLEPRAHLLSSTPPAAAADVSVIEEIMRLDRDLSSAIRERMIEIRNESRAGKNGQRALSSYGRRSLRRSLAIDGLS